jgi:aspartate ammonia-lyase
MDGTTHQRVGYVGRGDIPWRSKQIVKDTHRIEHDLLGDRPVPAEPYYGVPTLRAVENFPITGNPISIYPDLIRALACIKQAAALANHELRLLDRERADAIVKACEEIRAGKLHEQPRWHCCSRYND